MSFLNIQEAFLQYVFSLVNASMSAVFENIQVSTLYVQMCEVFKHSSFSPVGLLPG